MEKRQLIRLFYEVSNIPVILFSGQDILRKESHPIKDFNLPLLIFAGIRRPLPAVFYGVTPEFLYFGGLCIPGTDEVLFLGPILRSPCSDRQARNICRRIGRPVSDAARIEEYMNATGGRTVESILSGLRLLCLLFGLPQPEEVTHVSFRWELPYPILPFPPEERLSEADRNLEYQILSNIRMGNIDVLNEIITKYFPTVPYQPVAIVPIHRTYILGANDLFVHETINAGVDRDDVLRLSVHYIDEILAARTATDLSDLFFRLIIDYARMTAELNGLPSSSPVVRYIHRYIHTHLDEQITPHLLAEKLNMNCSYLCTLFKKETGMTVSHYVRQEKIRAARQLLVGSDLSLVEISEALGFSSQSYFGRVFRESTGMTPEAYRTARHTL